MAERRKHERLSRRVRVRYWRHGQPDEIFTAFSKDISLGGLYISTNKPLTKGSRIQLELITPGGGFLAPGVVARTITYPREMQQLKTGGMGVRFVSLRAFLNDLLFRAHDDEDPLPAEYPQYAEGEANPAEALAAAAPTTSALPSAAPSAPPVAAEPERAPASAAFPAATGSRAYATLEQPRSWRKKSDQQEIGTRVVPQYPVVFDSNDAFLTSYDRDLRFGGLFVPTTSPAPIDSKVELTLHVPAMPVQRIEATVVHVAGGASPGIGVQFSDAGILERLSSAAQHSREVRARQLARA